MSQQEFNICPKCGKPVPAPFKAHIEALGGCPEGGIMSDRVFSIQIRETIHYTRDYHEEELAELGVDVDRPADEIIQAFKDRMESGIDAVEDDMQKDGDVQGSEFFVELVPEAS